MGYLGAYTWSPVVRSSVNNLDSDSSYGELTLECHWFH